MEGPAQSTFSDGGPLSPSDNNTERLGKRDRDQEDGNGDQAGLIKRVKRLEEITSDLESKRKISKLENELEEKNGKIGKLEEDLRECQKSLFTSQIDCLKAENEVASLNTVKFRLCMEKQRLNTTLREQDETIKKLRKVEEESKNLLRRWEDKFDRVQEAINEE